MVATSRCGPWSPVFAGVSTALLAALLAGTTGCDARHESSREHGAEHRASHPVPDSSARRPSVLLIVLDTLRADHLGLYGYSRPTSPRLDEFARDAVVYRRAEATAPWTLPSHASLFTGLYPYEHGARTYEVEVKKRKKGQLKGKHQDNVAALDARHLTLAELLQSAGYRTSAVGANVAYLNPKYGLSQGFEHYDCAHGRVQEINARAASWLADAGEQPFFLFLNYMDVHRPYNCVARADFDGGAAPERSAELLRQFGRLLLGEGQPPPAEGLAELVDLYDVAIANLDEGLGALFAHLREIGLYDSTLIVVTADHGEFFGEHELIEHSKDIYQPVVHVPLIVKLPGSAAAGTFDDGWVSLTHVPGLILEHIDLPPGAQDAQRLLSHWPRSDVLVENYFSRLHDLRKAHGARFNRIRRGLYSARYKYIHSSDGAHELYDLERDPAELENLVEREPDLANDLQRRLDARRADPDAAAPELVETSDEDLEALEALGYGGDDE